MNTRRQLIKALGAAPLALGATSLLLGLSGRVGAQTGFVATELGKGLSLIQGAGSNVVVAEGPDSVVIVNGGSEDKADALLAEIKRLTNNKPVSALFNTNWRPEHAGLNHLLGPAGTPVLAHENSRLWQNADFYVEWQDTHYTPMPKVAQANKTFYQNGSLQLGSETIEYGIVSQCNTDGDIYVHFKNADVLVVGDMLGAESRLRLRGCCWRLLLALGQIAGDYCCCCCCCWCRPICISIWISRPRRPIWKPSCTSLGPLLLSF